MKRIIFFGLIIVAGLVGLTSSFAQDITQQKENKSASGRVVAMDWVAGMLVVNTGEDEITFEVPSDVEITKGEKEIGFSELNIGDNVAVEYCDECFAGLKAVKIVVKIG